MRHITQEGLNLIKRFEGFEPEIYLDAAGLPTIGYGHLIRKGEHKMFENGISEAAGEALLIKDVLLAEQAVCRLINVPLTNGQFDALVSFPLISAAALSSAPHSAARQTERIMRKCLSNYCGGSGQVEESCEALCAAVLQKQSCIWANFS